MCSSGTNHGDHRCGGSGKLWKVKWQSGGVGKGRNGGSGDLEAVMVSQFFFEIIGRECAKNG